MQKNAGAKPLRWLDKTNSQSKNSTPTGRCQAETDKFAGVNFFDSGNDLHFLCRTGRLQQRNLFQNHRKFLNFLTEETAGRIILAEGPLRSGFL